MYVPITFQGSNYFIPEETLNGLANGPMAYPNHIDESGDIKPECAFELSFAHVYPSTKAVMRFGKVIGTFDEIVAL